MKKNLARNVLAAITLAVLLGTGSHQRVARAQTEEHAPVAAASTQQAQSPAKEQREQDPEDEYSMSPSVVWLGSHLGMDPNQSSTAFKLANFALLAIAIGWVVTKVLPKLLRNRSVAIQKNLADARTATEEARARLSGVEERLSKLDGEIAALRTHAVEDTAAAEKRIKAAVEDEKKKILSAAEQEIAAAASHARKQLQQYAAGLVIEQAAHKLAVTAETDRLLVQAFVQRLAGDESKKGKN